MRKVDLRKVYVCEILKQTEVVKTKRRFKARNRDLLCHWGYEGESRFGLFEKTAMGYKHVLTEVLYSKPSKRTGNQYVINPNNIQEYMKANLKFATRLVNHFESFEMDMRVVEILEDKLNEDKNLKQAEENLTKSINKRDKEVEKEVEKCEKSINSAGKELQNKVLIPGGGTAYWLLACEKFGYSISGEHKLVESISISHDCRIEIQNHHSETLDYYTSVCIWKKELSETKEPPYEYERSFNIFYPYGSRFDKSMLKQIVGALSLLMDKARDLPNTLFYQGKINEIEKKEKQLLDLLMNGTSDPLAVKNIMKNIQLLPMEEYIRPARTKKDWLPYFTEPLFSEKEWAAVQAYRESKRNEEENENE